MSTTTDGAPITAPPPLAQEYLRQNDTAARRPVDAAQAKPGFLLNEEARRTAATARRDAFLDGAGTCLVVLGCAGGVALTFVCVGPAAGLGLLCALLVVAGLVLGRI